MSIYNEDELNAPTWMNEVYFESVLKIHLKNEDVKVRFIRSVFFTNFCANTNVKVKQTTYYAFGKVLKIYRERQKKVYT